MLRFVAGLLQGVGQRTWEVFVDQEARGKLPDGANLVARQRLRRVCENRAYLFFGYPVLSRQILEGQIRGQLREDEIDRHTGPGDDRTAEPNRLVDRDVGSYFRHALTSVARL